MKCGDTCRHNISKLNAGLSVKLLHLPFQGSGKALGDDLEGASSIFLQERFILVRHIYSTFRLLCGGWLRCTPAFVKWHLWPYPLKFLLWSTATHTPTAIAPPATPPRALARLVSSSQALAGLAWHGMVWYGFVPEPSAFIMKCGDTCRHNISKLNSGLSVKLLHLPFQGSGKASGDNLEGACSIFLQRKFHFGTPHLLDFQVAVCWLARLYACFRKVAPLALPVEVFALVHCHHTPPLPFHPRQPRARARSPRLVQPRHGWFGLAWYGMVWLCARAKCFHNEVR